MVPCGQRFNAAQNPYAPPKDKRKQETRERKGHDEENNELSIEPQNPKKRCDAYFSHADPGEKFNGDSRCQVHQAKTEERFRYGYRQSKPMDQREKV